MSCSFNFLIILALPLITLRHRHACVSVCTSARARLCHPWTQQISRSLIDSRRASQGLPKCQGGEFAALCAPACSYTRELNTAHHSHWSQMVGKSLCMCVYVGENPVSLQELAKSTTKNKQYYAKLKLNFQKLCKLFWMDIRKIISSGFTLRQSLSLGFYFGATRALSIYLTSQFLLW